MKILQHIGLAWLFCLAAICAELLLSRKAQEMAIAEYVLWASSALVGTISYHLWKREIRRGIRWMFLNFACFFLYVALINPAWDILINLFSITGDWPQLFFVQYQSMVYFLLLFFCAVFIVVDEIGNHQSVFKKYMTTLLIAGGVWGLLSYPLFLNPKFLLWQPNYRDYVSVRSAVRKLEDAGKTNPSAETIAASIDFGKYIYRPPLAQLTGIQKQQRIEEILPYVPGMSGYMIYFEPLNIRESFISALGVLLLVGMSIRQFIVDSNKGAYVEKIIWGLILYCVLEALHLYLFTKTTDYETFEWIEGVGKYLSLAVLWLLGCLFALRLRFVESVVGAYYERRLAESAGGITRWRDSFDDWLVREFMNGEELDARFVVRRKRHE